MDLIVFVALLPSLTLSGLKIICILSNVFYSRLFILMLNLMVQGILLA